MFFVRGILPLRCPLLTSRCFSSSTVVKSVSSGSAKGHHNYQTVMPRLAAEKSDGTLEDIPEEDLYRFKESVQVSQRYLKFDLQQLLKVVVYALSSDGARYCTRVLKCREGLNSKAFLLTMDDGSEIIARLPNPIAGPAYYTTASEVATREFLRDVLKVPSPCIIAWSADRSNPVGAQYILEEKAPGIPLGRLWYHWPMRSKLDMISQIVELEGRLASTTFSKSGCIYFKGDIPGDASGTNSLTTNPPLPSPLLERFSLGPLVSSGMWRGRRANMDMNRGPYTGPREFVEAMAINEIKFVKTYGQPRFNYHRSSTEPELPDELLHLLDRYLKLAPAMIPPEGPENSPTLWHPDLHLDNVFVDPKSRRITQVLDWQSATAMPFFYQCGIPRMFKKPDGVSNNWDVPELPDNYDTLEQSEKEAIDSARSNEICHKYYLAETRDQNPRHWATLNLENIHVQKEPSRLVVNVWEDRDVFFLRQALHLIAEQWPRLCPGSGNCPVTFSEQEIKAHAAEEESMSNVAEILRIFHDRWGLSPDGMVDAIAYKEMTDAVADMKETFLTNADNEAERELFSKLWPYQDSDD